MLWIQLADVGEHRNRHLFFCDVSELMSFLRLTNKTSWRHLVSPDLAKRIQKEAALTMIPTNTNTFFRIKKQEQNRYTYLSAAKHFLIRHRHPHSLFEDLLPYLVPKMHSYFWDGTKLAASKRNNKAQPLLFHHKTKCGPAFAGYDIMLLNGNLLDRKLKIHFVLLQLYRIRYNVPSNNNTSQ